MRRSESRTGFTLVELLVVVAIIGVLIGLLSFAVQAAINKSNKTQALVVVKSVAMALEGYMDEYPEEDWPSVMAQFPSEATGVGYVTEDLFRMLSGEKVDGLNRRKMPFFDMSRKLRVGGDAALTEPGLLDPWGRVYRLSMDLDGNGSAMVKEGGLIRVVPGHRVVVWSFGKDRLDIDDKTRLDNVRSWH